MKDVRADLERSSAEEGFMPSLPYVYRGPAEREKDDNTLQAIWDVL